jgi:hypothetical protein
MALWKDEHVLTTYELARGGCNQEQIIKAIGVSKPTFISWKKKHPQLRDALRRGCVGKRGKQVSDFTFRDLVEQRLPKDLRRVWNKIRRFEREKCGIGKIEALLENKGKTVRQYLFVHALMISNFNATQARQKVNISVKVYKSWLKDPEFAALVDEVEECKKDFFEDYLIRLVKSMDSAAIRMVNQTYNADRGYGEKVKAEIETTHKVQHNVEINVLSLSVEEKRMLLDKIRQVKRVESRVVKDNDNGG